jgi:hypothetical protein
VYLTELVEPCGALLRKCSFIYALFISPASQPAYHDMNHLRYIQHPVEIAAPLTYASFCAKSHDPLDYFLTSSER